MNFLSIQNRKKEGFTFIETLVSLAIIAIIVVMLSFSVSTSIRAVRKAQLNNQEDIELLEYDNSIRKLINKVVLPEWLNKYDFSYNSNSISFKWIDGCETITVFNLNSNMDIQDISLLNYKSDRPAGLRIKYIYKNHTYVCEELFSSIPFGQVEL